MNFIYDIFSYPFGWLLWLLYQVFGHNYALSLIAFTLLAKLIILPSSISTQKNQAKTLRTRSKIEKIRQKYAGDQAKINEELQAFYEKEGYGSMTAGCGTLLIQFPIIIGLYGAIYKPLSYILRLDKATVETLTNAAANFQTNTKNIRLNEILVLSHTDELKAQLPDIPDKVWDLIVNFDFTAFGFDLGTTPSTYGWKSMYALVPLAAFLSAMITSVYSLIKTKKSTPDAANTASMGCMMLFMPFMSLWLAYTFPIGIGVYWAINSLLSFFQMLILNKVYEPKRVIAKMMVEETNVRRAKEESVKLNTELMNNNEI